MKNVNDTTFSNEIENETVRRVTNDLNMPKGFVPDLRSLARKQEGFETEIGSSDADKIKEKIEAAAQKQPVRQPSKLKRLSSTKRRQPVINTIAGYRVSKALPDDARIGWTAFSNIVNPGGSLGILATEKKQGLNNIDKFYKFWIGPFSDDWQDFGVIFIIGIGFWLIIKLGGGIIPLTLGLFFTTSYYKLNTTRFQKRITDDISREFAFIALEASDYEKADWLNNFIQKFWLIFEPVISAFVIENIDTYIVDYLPGFLDSVRLTTFTLGSKPFVVESIHSLTDTEPNTVCMDWTVSFVPDDLTGMTEEDIEKKENPKVVLNIRLGKGFMGTAFPVLLEDMSFRGRIRVKLQFMSKMPHVKLVEVCFMEKPQFDYVLKPLGGETFGFDVNNIPGLQGFVREQTHAILGPMMYYPNVFAYDIDKFFSGELDISQANGVLAVTVHSCSKINTSESSLNPFIRFYLDEAQELEKTSIIEETRTPHWNETKFLLLHDLESILTMELRTTNNTKKAGKRLARAHFNLQDIRDTQDLEINNLELPMLRHGRFISSLQADMKYLPISKPIQQADGTMVEAEPSNSGILRITVHECKNLGSNKINPFASVKINGVDRFETPTFRRTANPKFERPYEILVLDMTEVYIRVTLTDRIDFAGDSFLGAWTAYLTDIMKDQEEKEFWWDLKRGETETKARLRLSVQWKPVVMSGLSKMGGLGSGVPAGVVRFSIWSAKNLGKQSPYVRIKSGKQVRARTEILDNTEVPEWGEFHYVPIHSIREDLVLEVMSWTSGYKDKSLGSTIVHLSDLITECKDEHQNVYYESKHKKLDRDDILNMTRGSIVYSIEFYPTMMLPEIEQDTEDTEQLKYDTLPKFDLHGLPIRYTPDDLIDLSSYGSGILTIKIHEVKSSTFMDCYCRVMIDSLTSQHQTNTLKGRTLTFNETTDAFIKDAGFSRVAIELKPAEKTEKDDDRIAYWFDSSDRIIQQIQRRAREQKFYDNEGSFDLRQMLMHTEQDEGEWYDLLGIEGAQIRLSFGYSPLLTYTVNPDESIENQGVLTCTLLRAKDLKAADKSGTSDPYVKFTVNGEVVYKSSVVKKTCHPVWKNESFQVPIISRVTASFRIEVFDWNQLTGAVPLGSGGITIRGDMVESFSTHECDIPLDGQAGDTGSVRVRFKWEPQLLLRKKMHTSIMGTTRRMTTKLGTTAFNWSQPPKETSRSTSIQSKMSSLLNNITEESTSKPSSVKGGGRMSVEIVEARGLRGEQDKLNPVAYVFLDKEQILKTRKVKKTTIPQWQEKISFDYNQNTTLEIKVKDSHTFNTSDIGQVSIPLVPVDKWFSLEPEASGEVHVRLSLR